MNQWLDEIRAIAYQAARTVHKRYKPYFDVSDVNQELMVWALAHPEKITEWLSPEPGSQEYKDGIKKLGKTMMRNADRICRKMKAQKLGYETRDEQFYSHTVIEDLLELAWVEIVNPQEKSGEKTSGGGNPAEGGNYIVQLFDVRRAVHKLDPSDQLALQLAYYEKLEYREIAEQLNVSASTAHRKVQGALRRLGYALGGSNPYGKDE